VKVKAEVPTVQTQAKEKEHKASTFGELTHTSSPAAALGIHGWPTTARNNDAASRRASISRPAAAGTGLSGGMMLLGPSFRPRHSSGRTIGNLCAGAITPLPSTVSSGSRDGLLSGCLTVRPSSGQASCVLSRSHPERPKDQH
jgi:hypothetical protein